MTTPEPTEAEMNVRLCEVLGINVKSKFWFPYEAQTNGRKFNTKVEAGIEETRLRNECGMAGKVYIEEIPAKLPNHFADSLSGLWACHEAEKTLDTEQNLIPDETGFQSARDFYMNNLQEITDARPTHQDDCGWAYLTASAPQRAKALYLTLCRR